MPVVTGAGAAGFRNIKPQDLAQDFGADQSAVIDAALTGAQDIVKAVDVQLDSAAQRDKEKEDEYTSILADQKTEQARLDTWIERTGAKELSDFDVKDGFTINDGKIVYEDQVKLHALQLRGGKARRYAKDKKRINRGKQARSRKEGDVKFDAEGNPIDDAGNIIVDAETDYTTESFQGEDAEISESDAAVYAAHPSLDPRGQSYGRSKESIQELSMINNKMKSDILPGLKQQVENLNPDDVPRITSLIAAMENGTVQVRYDHDTKTNNFVWKDADGNIQSVQVGAALGEKGLEVINGGKVQQPVDAKAVGSAIGISKINNVSYIDDTSRAQIQNNFTDFLDQDGNRQSYINTYGLPIEVNADGQMIWKGEKSDNDIDLNDDGIITDDELLGHFNEVYGGTVNSFYRDSLKAPAPAPRVSEGLATVQALHTQLQTVVQTQDASALHGAVIGGVKIERGATINGSILTNRTPVAVSKLEGVVEQRGEVLVEINGQETLITPKNFGRHKAALEQEGSSVIILDKIDLSNPAIIQSTLSKKIETLPTDDRKGTQPYIAGAPGVSYYSSANATPAGGGEAIEVNLTNNRVDVGATIEAPDGTYDIQVGDSTYTVTIADNEVSKSKLKTSSASQSDPTFELFEDFDNKEAWQGTSVTIDIAGVPSVNGLQIVPGRNGNANQVISIFDKADRNAGYGSDGKRIHDSLYRDPVLKYAYLYYKSTGRLHPGLLTGNASEASALYAELQNKKGSPSDPGGFGV